MPTMPFIAAGQMIEPSVSVPTATVASPAATATAEPALEPQGLRSSTYGFFVCPPRPLQPLLAWLERKLAHSLRLVLPRISAPALRSRSTRPASRAAGASISASEPAVVSMWSPVSILSLSSTGMPYNGPRDVVRFASSAPASSSASGLVSITARKVGPERSIRWMRSSSVRVSWRLSSVPASMRCCSCSIDA